MKSLSLLPRQMLLQRVILIKYHTRVDSKFVGLLKGRVTKSSQRLYMSIEHTSTCSVNHTAVYTNLEVLCFCLGRRSYLSIYLSGPPFLINHDGHKMFAPDIAGCSTLRQAKHVCGVAPAVLLSAVCLWNHHSSSFVKFSLSLTTPGTAQ